MTRIERVDVLRFHRRLDGRAWNPSFRWHERSAPLLVIHVSDGTFGVGEAWSAPADPGPVLARLAEEVAPRLLGTSPGASGVAGLARFSCREQAAAWSAADIACRDADARARGVPLWRALGGADGRVRVYASGGLYRDGTDEAALAAEMRSYVDMGHAAVKMKVGALGLAADGRRVAAVRAAIGSATRLWVDAVNQLDVATAAVWCDRMLAHDVHAIQAPLPFDEVAGMAGLNRRIPVVATEAEHRIEYFAGLLSARAVGYLQFCLGLCGGFGGALRLDRMAREAGVRTTPQTYSTVVLQAASLHFGAASANVDTVENHCFHDHLRHLAPPAMRQVKDGWIELDDAPGLGIPVPRPGKHEDGSVIALHASCRL